MPLESVTHISDLVATNPTSTDPKSEGDNHLRNIKTALKTDFPNISGPVTKTHTQLNNALDKTGDTMTGPLAQAAGTASLPSYTFSGDTNTGMWSPGADTLAWSTGGTEHLRIDSSGNVGVGNAPAATSGRSVDLDGVTLQPLYAMRATGVTSASATWTLDTVNSLVSFVSSNWAMRWNVNGSERLRIDTSGDVLVTGSGGLGYGVGSGGTVGQVTNRNTGVALNKPSGQITLVSGTTTAGTFNSFTLTNSSIAATDGVEVCFTSGATANSYGLLVTAIAAGSCRIQIHNIAAVGVAEAPVIQFRVIKGATS